MSRQDGAEAGLLIRQTVAKLGAIDREVLLLREFEEVSYAEIAVVLQLPLNAVRSRLFRARTRCPLRVLNRHGNNGRANQGDAKDQHGKCQN